ncbi:DNA-repair protein rad13 [Nosema bombycis CQ1]|uniref:DNA-repair protein rad13 n=1 Tax=Nosema bombycis (strain CQ1 / CVCC 102059) TaxID=578461 RepID=R0KS62_NOSB1|nr:DNA-repair protein rad13 [Nosema bombycis CQ1]|eukprot:EOB13606.1 DNA-repair protein rad13 [Nosema bombycis CQ1]
MQKFKPMGVKGLWGMLQEAAEVEIPENKTLAIDVSIWIHYYKDMQEKDIIYNVSKRIIKLLYHNIKPVFIFDGTPNEMKRKVLIERKKLNNTKLIKDIVENRICKKCKKSIRTCRHGGMLNEKIRNDLENQIRVKLESHDERWGEDYKQDIELNVYHKPARYKQNKVVIDETLINDIVKSNKLTTKQKLKMLLKMREKRKEQLGYNDDTLTDFSDSQLVNIKKRNLISFYIRKLEKEKSSSKVQSNCYKEFTFKKDEKQTIQEINNKHIDSEVDTVEGESLDRLFSSDEESKSEEEIIDEQPSSNLDRLFNLCSSQLQDKVNNLDNDDHENNVLCFEPSSEIIDISKDKNPDCVNRPDLDEDSSSSSSQEINVENRDEEISFESIQRKNITFEDNETIYDFTNVQLIFKKTIEIFNLPYLVPPGEADSQCGYLSAQGIVDGVVTEDNDVLSYGGVVYRNFFRKNKHIEKFTPHKILENCKFSQIDLINISYVLGSDYTIGINGIGAKKVVDYIKSEDFLNFDIKKYQEIYLKPVIDKHYKPKFNVIDLRKVIKYYKHKDIESDKINELIFYITNIKK